MCLINLGDCKISCLDSFSVGSKSMVALSLAELPGKNGQIVLATGGLDNKIHLYCGERKGKVIVPQKLQNFIILHYFIMWKYYLFVKAFLSHI